MTEDFVPEVIREFRRQAAETQKEFENSSNQPQAFKRNSQVLSRKSRKNLRNSQKPGKAGWWPEEFLELCDMLGMKPNSVLKWMCLELKLRLLGKR